jgi:type II secretory pathway pseudopilin PulG
MHHKKSTQSHNKTGFALLMSLIVVGVLISIGLTVLELTISQVRLATNARDSETAFHAANAGLECALYWRRQAADSMETGQDISVDCFGESTGLVSPTNIVSGADGDAYLYTYELTWGTNNDRCSEANTLVASSTPTGSGVTISNVASYIAGYTGGTNFTCDAGGRCTIMSVRGYNKACGQTTTYGTVQREVLLQF